MQKENNLTIKKVKDLTDYEKVQVCKARGMCLGCPLLIPSPIPLGVDHCLMRNSKEQIERLKTDLNEIKEREVVLQ